MPLNHGRRGGRKALMGNKELCEPCATITAHEKTLEPAGPRVFVRLKGFEPLTF